MKKIIFMDVDGTLVGFKGNVLYTPQSAINAIRKTREKGNLVYLCTGRGMAEIDDDLLSIGFDGIIGAAGGFIIENGKKIYHKRMKNEEVKELMEYFNNNKIMYYLESNDGLYCSEDFKDFMRNDPNSCGWEELMGHIDDADLNEINKISFMSHTLAYQEIAEKLNDQYNVVAASWVNEDMEAGEVSIKGITKASAIEFLLNHLGMKVEDSFGFGDSMNDREMLEYCNTAVVMGNGMHGIKEYADFITKDLEDDGIAYAMEFLNLI